MKDLRTIRIFLSILFFVGAVVYLTLPQPPHQIGATVEKAQIIPSMIASSMGAILFWIAATFIIGRAYCSTVCPIGTFQDFAIRLRRVIPPLNKPFSYRHANPLRYQFLLIYIVCVILGVGAVSFWIEPWDIMHNICGAANPSRQKAFWGTFGVGITAGIGAGIVSAVLLVVCSLFTGRGFCTDICPIGVALGAVSEFSIYHIEIDPDKCINCMKCEEVCKSRCVKVVSRLVDNSRCVRCFDCLTVCPNDAIRLQINRNRRSTPLFRKVNHAAK